MALTINAPTASGTTPITGKPVGSFLIHEKPSSALVDLAADISTWRVTHIATGMRLPIYFFTTQSAEAFAAEIEAVLDWSRIKVDRGDGVVGRVTKGALTKGETGAIAKFARARGGYIKPNAQNVEAVKLAASP